MIVFKYCDTFFCYLCNPKCGTHTFYDLWNKFLKKFVTEIHFARSGLRVSGYSDYNYYHCNLEGAIKFFEEKHIDLKNVVFFTTIRNPFERVLSNYWYSLKILYLKKFDDSLIQQKDFNKFVLCSDTVKKLYINMPLNEFDSYDFKPPHYKNFEPKNFRFSENYNVHVNVLRLENWYEDFELFFKKYNFSENLILLNTIKTNISYRSCKLEFNDEIRNYVINNYSMDFEDGKYDLHPK